MKKWIFFISLIFICVIYFSFFHSKSNPINLKTIIVKKQTIIETATAIGDIEPRQTSTVKSQVAGIVSKIFHHEGDFIKKGDKLITINPAPPPTTIATDQNKVNQVRINLENAGAILKIYLYLLVNHIIGPNYSELLSAKTYQVDKAQLKFDTQ